MGSKLVTTQKLESLRSFAGAHIPDPRLRAALIRSGGDVNAAAYGLLTDGTLGRADAPIQVAAANSQPLRPQNLHVDTQTHMEKRFPTKEQRRSAWRQFYYENYKRATEHVGADQAEINDFIADLWRNLGKDKRERYIKAVLGKLDPDDEPVVQLNGHQAAASSAGQVTGIEASAERPSQMPQPAPVTDLKLGANGHPVEQQNAPVLVACDDGNRAGADSAEIHVGTSDTGHLRNGYGKSIWSHAHNPQPSQRDQDHPQGEWPKPICTHFCRGSINIPGKKKLISADDHVVLEVPPLPRAAKLSKGKGKRIASAKPAKIVRFSRKGREIGILAPDTAKVLAPALQTGLVVSTCKVIDAPERPRMFADVFLEVTLSLTKEAFDGAADQEAVECGLKSETNPEEEEEGEVTGEAGVDKKRLDVVNMILSLNICQPPERERVKFPKPVESEVGKAGAVSEEGAEAYYRTVSEISKDEVTSFVPPMHLTCTLREYQKAGVGWMVAREKFGSRAIDKDPNAVDFMLNPLWKRKVFLDGGVFFVNPSIGGFALEPPLDNVGEPYGGILADEMGLGKTVQCIACIVHDLEGQRKDSRHRKQRCPSRRKRSASPISLQRKIESSGSSQFFESKEALGKAEEDEITPLHASDQARFIDHHKKANVKTNQGGKRIAIVNCVNDAHPESEKNVCVDHNPQKSISLMETLSDDICREGSKELGKQDNPTVRGSQMKKRKTRDPVADDRDGGDGTSDSHKFYTEESDDGFSDEDWKPSDGAPSTTDSEQAINRASRESKGAKHRQQEESDDGSDEDIFESPQKKRQKSFSGKGKRIRKSVSEKVTSGVGSCAPVSGGTLVVCPMSLVTQWMDELDLHIESRFLRVTSHYGQSRGDANSISLKYADVVVTTYGVVASEYTRDSRDSTTGAAEDGSALFEIHWRRVILDEAHTIRNRTTRVARAVFRLEAERRWCVTGTVIHNHVNDVFSLLHFLRLKPWSSWAVWQKGIVANIESKNADTQKVAMSLLRDIISSVTLRRKKTTKDVDGKCIIRLPKKTVELVRLVPSEEERDFYRALHERSKVQFDTFVKQGKVMNNFATVLELLLRLRQACDHPYLVFAAPSKDSIVLKDKDKMFRQFLGSAGASSSQFVENVLKEAESGQLQEARECPICLDVIDDPVAPRECGHPACRVCLDETIRRSRRCPVCRIPLDANSIATLPRATRFAVDLKKRWRSSAKIDALLEDLQEIQLKRKKGPVGKTVVFSQFTSMLDLVGIALDRAKMKTLRIDGSVTQAKRASILQSFAIDDELMPGTANVLLVSLKAGGVGLNLVSASFAILLDIHWNPQIDAQAQDRVHRHGQTRDVVIKRYLIKESVEEKLLDVQDRKKDIADGALGVATDEDKKQARLSELKLLFSAQ